WGRRGGVQRYLPDDVSTSQCQVQYVLGGSFDAASDFGPHNVTRGEHTLDIPTVGRSGARNVFRRTALQPGTSALAGMLTAACSALVLRKRGFEPPPGCPD